MGRLPIVSAVLACIAACALPSAAATAQRTAPRTLARRDAMGLLELVRLPASARRSATIPAGTESVLGRPAEGPPATRQVVDRHRWWRVPRRPHAVLAFVAAHLPAHARRISTGAGVLGGHALRSVVYALPALGDALPERLLVVGATPTDDGAAVRVDAQVVWRHPPARPFVPAGTRVVTATALRGPARGRTATVRAHAAVRRIVRLLDRLPLAVPGARSCPGDDGPLLRLALRRAGGGGLARVVVDPGGCGTVTLEARGRPRLELDGGAALVRRLRPMLPAGFVPAR